MRLETFRSFVQPLGDLPESVPDDVAEEDDVGDERVEAEVHEKADISVYAHGDFVQGRVGLRRQQADVLQVLLLPSILWLHHLAVDGGR